jgi:hypothetical protein
LKHCSIDQLLEIVIPHHFSRLELELESSLSLALWGGQLKKADGISTKRLRTKTPTDL